MDLGGFGQRLAEAAAWCASRPAGRPSEVFWTPELRPERIGPRVVHASTYPSWLCQPSLSDVPAPERSRVVDDLARRRTEALGRLGQAPTDSELTGGRLLLFDPDGTLSCGAAEMVTHGFLDVDNVPTWDAWVWYVGEHLEVPGAWSAWSSYLVSWVPPWLVDRVDEGVDVNPEVCIVWAHDQDDPFTRDLRRLGLLPGP